MLISKLVGMLSESFKTKTNSKYLIGYLDKALRPSVLIMPKTSGYAKAFKVREGEKEKPINQCF